MPYDREALRRAVRARNIDRLEVVLETVKENRLSEELVKEVREARRLLAVLRRMNTIKASLQDWSGVQAEIGMTARKHFAFLKRIVGVNSALIQVAHAQRAQGMLSRFNLDMDRVQSISQPLALFFSWLTTITDEVIGIDSAGKDD
ncbi:hypothetical protein ACOMHN_025985 [Nucella lapillus]